MASETRWFLLRDGESLEVTRDLRERKLTFVLRGRPFEMHIQQGYHLARFLAGISSAMADEPDIPSPGLEERRSRRGTTIELDLSDAKEDPE